MEHALVPAATPTTRNQTTPTTVAPRSETLLGDADDKQERLEAFRQEVQDTITALGGRIDKPKDGLSFVTNLRYKAVGGQQLTANFMSCGKHISSTGATRVVDHFKECALCLPEVKQAFSLLREQTAQKRKDKADHTALVTKEAEVNLQLAKVQKAELKQTGLRPGFGSAEQAQADKAIAQCFYANGLTFGAADTAPDSYYRAMCHAIKATPAGYVPPSAKTLSDRKLEEEYDDAKKQIAKRDAEGELSRKFGRAYTSDGWDSCDSLPLINSAYILANDSGVYIRSVDTSGETKSAEYCAALMIYDIYEAGCTNFLILVTDTCPTMRKIVEDEFPWMSAAPCQTHCPSLLLKDISSLAEPAQVIKKKNLITNWFTNHQLPLAILREKVRARLGKSKELKKAGATGIGTKTFVGERLQEVQCDLQATVVYKRYVKQNYMDAADDSQTGNGGTVTRQNKGERALARPHSECGQ